MIKYAYDKDGTKIELGDVLKVYGPIQAETYKGPPPIYGGYQCTLIHICYRDKEEYNLKIRLDDKESLRDTKGNEFATYEPPFKEGWVHNFQVKKYLK